MQEYYHIREKDLGLRVNFDIDNNTTLFERERHLTQDGKTIIMFTANNVGTKFNSKYAVIAGYQITRNDNKSIVEPIPTDKRKELTDICLAKGWADAKECVNFWND